MEIVHWLAEQLRPYSGQIALALVATSLVLYGDAINRWVRKLVRRQMVLVRVTVFIALCTFGYGALTIWLTPWLSSWLVGLSALHFVLAVTGGFILIGILAERYHS